MTWADAMPAIIMTAKIAGLVAVCVGAGMALHWLNRDPWDR